MNTLGQDRLYTIERNDEYGIVAGRLDGASVLIRFSPGNFMQLTFSEQGDLLSAHRHSYPSDNPLLGKLFIKQQVSSDSPIRVKKFFLADAFLGIQEMPSSLEETIEEQDLLDEEESAYFLEELDSWNRSQQFVLQWDNEYYLNKDGRVVAS